MMRNFRSLPLLLSVVVSVIVSAGSFDAAPALALSPVLTVNTVSLPTNLPPGGKGELLLQDQQSR